MTTRAVIYIRVSDPSQIENNSLETQLTACKRFAKNKGYEIVKVYREEGKSAKHIYTREELSKLIDFCKDKKSRIDIMLVYKYDRFSRNAEEALATIALFSKYNVHIESVTENHADDPMGRMIRTIMLGMAQLDNEMKGQVVKSNMISAFRRGLWPFKCPVGYMRPFRTKEESRGLPPIKDPNLAPIISDMFKKASTGIYTKAQLARMMNQEGFGDHYRAKATHKVVDGILSKTFYYGNMYAKKWDEYSEGLHVPLTDKDTWEQAYHRVILKKKKHIYQDIEKYPLKGSLLCEHCNKPLTTSPTKGRNRMYYYYECRNKDCKEVRVEAKDIHPKFETLLASLKPSERVLKLFEHMVFNEWDKVISESERQADKVEARIGRLKEDLKSIRRSVDKGITTEEEAKEQSSEARKEITLLGLERSDLRLEQYDKEIVREFTEYFLMNLDRLWFKLDLSKRQALLTQIFPSGITCDKNREIRTVELSPSFELIQALNEQKGVIVTP